MTEAELERVLERGARRMRLNTGLRWACAALLAALAAGAGLVGWARLEPEWAGTVFAGYWLPLALAACGAVAGFWRARPAGAEVALRLDRAAGLEEHLATWEEFRRVAPSADELARGFVEAQRRATLRKAEGVEPSRHLPLRWPAWSRALWLGLLALGCAVLMPEHPPRPEGVREGLSQDGAGREGAGPGSRPANGARFDRLSRGEVELFTPTETRTIELAVYGSDVPDALREEAVRLLEAKIGTLPESEWSPEVREWLKQLRKKDGPSEAKTTEGAVTAAGTGQEPSAAPKGGAPPPPLPPLDKPMLLGVVKDRFPDVAAALERYYRD
jgi:hypothetical protein